MSECKNIENEFRIGNYFIGYDDKYGRIDIDLFFTLKKDRIAVDEIIKSFVPLTPEILENAGFKEVDGFVANGGEIEVDKYELGQLFTAFYSSSGAVKILYNTVELNHIKYLHQLQNLYHSLTGEELEIKL